MQNALKDNVNSYKIQIIQLNAPVSFKTFQALLRKLLIGQ